VTGVIRYRRTFAINSLLPLPLATNMEDLHTLTETERQREKERQSGVSFDFAPPAGMAVVVVALPASRINQLLTLS
jgi:hypothetical protein